MESQKKEKNDIIADYMHSINHSLEHLYEGIEYLFDKVEKIEQMISQQQGALK